MRTMMMALSAVALCGVAWAEGAKTPVPMTDVELDVVVAGAPGLGQLISANVQDLYGNTTNPRPGGHGVLPSLSPGPWVCANPADCSQGAAAGPSVGEIVAPFVSNGNASPDFANGTTKVKTNFGQPYQHGGVGP